MRIIIVFFLASFLFCCCNKTTKQENFFNEVKLENISGKSPVIFNCDTAKVGVYIEIEKQEIPISVDTLEVVIINNTDNTIEFGDVYFIEKYDGDKWDRITLDKDTLGNIIIYNLVGYSLNPNTFVRRTYNLIKCAYSYREGEYRIVIPYTQNGINLELYSEFALVKDYD